MGRDHGGSVPTYNLVHSTYVFLVTRATKVGKIVNPAVRPKYLKVNRYGRISATTFFLVSYELNKFSNFCPLSTFDS